MLVLSRKEDESLILNDDIKIVIVSVRGNRVRLGVSAPKEIKVYRGEIYDKIKSEESADKKE